MKVTIVGLGLIGGSLAKDLRPLEWVNELVGLENNPDHRDQALKLGLVDRVISKPQVSDGENLVILCTPVQAIEGDLSAWLDLLSDGNRGVITDMGSTKESICKKVANHRGRQNYVSAHPMAGTENSGPKAALTGLFAHKTAVICEREKSNGGALKIVEGMFKDLKMRIVYMDAPSHDLHAAYVSHLSHISSFVLANTVLKKERNATTIFDLAGGGFESTVRLAKSSPDMWAPIFGQNKNYVSQAIGDYLEILTEFKKNLDDGDDQKLREFMDEANAIRRVLSSMAQRLSGK